MAQLTEPSRVSTDTVEATYAAVNQTLNALVSTADDSQVDMATRSVLVYMGALFNGDGAAAAAAAEEEEDEEDDDVHDVDDVDDDDQSGHDRSPTADQQILQQQQQQHNGVMTLEAEGTMAGSSRAASSVNDSSGKVADSTAATTADTHHQQQQQQQQQPRGSVTLQKLQQLGRFLQAASNLDAFQSWLFVFSERHPYMATSEMLVVSHDVS
jgi:hypothetical protein